MKYSNDQKICDLADIWFQKNCEDLVFESSFNEKIYKLVVTKAKIEPKIKTFESLSSSLCLKIVPVSELNTFKPKFLIVDAINKIIKRRKRKSIDAQMKEVEEARIKSLNTLHFHKVFDVFPEPESQPELSPTDLKKLRSELHSFNRKYSLSNQMLEAFFKIH